MIPVLLRPTILITPNSNVFDSTLIISNEYTRRTLSIMKRRITMLKINPKIILQLRAIAFTKEHRAPS